MTIAPLKSKKQVFLSYSSADQELANEVAAELTGAGIDVVAQSDLPADETPYQWLRKALPKSNAMVVVLSRLAQGREIPASVLFEIGAAVGADKPIYLIVDDPSAKLPFHVRNLRVLPLNRVEEIARAVVS
jgi:hypothetical protein